MSRPVVLARVVRSGVEESLHLGSVAVADTGGGVVASAGDPRRPVFVRSAAKPFQASVSLALVGDEAGALEDAEVAVMAASHNGEKVHLRAVRGILARAGLGEEALRCPPVWPLDAEEARRVPTPSAILHDCSGKHAGMLLACRRAGLDVHAYPDPEHPLQERVRGAITAATGAPPIAEGTDGCGVPVHRVPLAGLATAFARLAVADALGDLASPARRVVDAMRAEPYLVAGRGRVCTTIMRANPGVVVKVGAEGVACAALLDRGLGVAIKVEDGAPRAKESALLRALEELGVVDPEAPEVARHARPDVLGGGRVVGAVEPAFSLE